MRSSHDGATKYQDASSAARRSPAAVLGALSPLIGLVLVVALFAILRPDRPLSLGDIRTISLHAMIVATAGMGMTLVIISGGIDLSVGSMVALCGVAAALASKQGWSLAGVLVAGIGTGILCGAYNGLLITALRLPPFIATLGTLGFFRGVAKWISDSRQVEAPTLGLERWVQPTPPRPWMLVAPGVWVMLALVVITGLTLAHTVFGRQLTAIGSNEDAAKRCGVAIRRVKTRVYATAGALVGIAGLMQFARLTQGDPTVAIGLELDVVAAVVIGGASLAGGHGSVLGTLAGAVMMAFLRNRCVACEWPNYVQEIIVGHIIIAAVAIDRWRAIRTGPYAAGVMRSSAR